MSLENRLAKELIRKHPARAAVALEVMGRERATSLLTRATARDAAPVLRRMTPPLAARILAAIELDKMTQVLEALPVDVAARLLRKIPRERADEALLAMSAGHARSLRSLLRFPEGSAGALMDPDVLALPETLTAKEALERVRETPDGARYNVYIVDAEQRLVGVVNLRELLSARRNARIADFMIREPQHLHARQDRSVVVAHRGWREAHSLPVVDDHGGYLGAVRYRTLRALEEELFGRETADADTSQSLGELFTAGAGALLEAFSQPSAPGNEVD